MRPWWLIACLLAFSGCATVGPSTLVDPHLPAVTQSSASYKTGRTENAYVVVRAMRTKTGGRTAHALGIIVARSDLNYPKITGLRSFGKPLPYKRLDRHRIGRLRAETGLIPLSRSEFNAFAGTGIEFRIYGKRGAYTVKVPARLFQM